MFASFAMTKPVGVWCCASWWSISKSWQVLLPGAAHISSTLWWLWTSKSKGGTIDTASCLEMLPISVSCVKKCLKCLVNDDNLMDLRLASKWYAKPSGYHFIARGASIANLPPISYLPMSELQNSSSMYVWIMLVKLVFRVIRKVVGNSLYKMSENSSHSASDENKPTFYIHTSEGVSRAPRIRKNQINGHFGKKTKRWRL